MEEGNTSLKVAPNKVYKDVVKVWYHYYGESAQKISRFISAKNLIS